MNYQLELFNRIISGEFIDTHPEIPGEQIKIILEKEVPRIKKDLTFDVYKLSKQKKIQTYIQNHQRSLIYLNETVEEKLNKVDESKKDLFNFIRIQLERLYVFLEKQFPDYLNNQLPVSRMLVELWDQENIVNLKYLLKNLNSPEIDEKLRTLVKDIISEVRTSHSLSINTYSYLTLLIEKLLIGVRKAKKLTNDLIEQTLFSYNFNDLSFFVYLTTPIQSALEKEEDPIEKPYILKSCLRQFRKRYQKTNLSYKPLLPSIKDQVVFWLEEELQFQSELAQPSIQQTNFKGEKLITSLSVSQLAYFHKLLFDVGVIPVKNQKEIARFLANNFKTMKTENLSPESINSKYYNIEEATKSVVKDVVIKMLNTINKKN